MGDSFDANPTDVDPTQPFGDSGRATLDSPELGTRYGLASVLGRGGMGEVRLARDLRIGREVAVKIMRANTEEPKALARFFREAHVQGLLDHPAVVPIHDLGVDPQGNPFFVMKRVSGTTLSHVLARDDEGEWSRAKLLARFVDVCFAIDYAHSRGVIHRDLKPANIMLGDFGETYVLDWGLARMLDTSRRSVLDMAAPAAEEGETQLGEVLGTPGYMSPEQARAEVVGPETDVYALGCILFEILARKPAIPRGPAALVMTLETECHHPGEHAFDIAPELDELCARATARQAAQRLSAHELAERIQAHLAGDRDLARRRDLAAQHARLAIAAEAVGNDASRATAMREAGRALALDPGNETAQRILGSLLLASPRTIPEEALAAADEDRGRTRQGVLRVAGRGYIAVVASIALLLLLPLRHAWLLAVTGGIAALTATVALVMARRLLPMRSPWFIVLLVLNCLLITMSGVLFTPLLLMPVFVVGSLTGWLQQPTSYSPWIVVVAHFVPFVAILGLEWAGVLPPTYHIAGGSLVVSPWLVDLTPFNTALIFVATLGAQTVNTAYVMLHSRFSWEAAQNRQHAQAWHLRQVVTAPV